MNTSISFAFGFAAAAHIGQTRRYTGEPYINHPREVLWLLPRNADINMQQAALLHDVIEDTPVTAEQLAAHFTAATTKLVVELTNQFTSAAYPGLNRAARFQLELDRLSRISPEAQTIKYADLIDNTRSIVEHDPKFAVTYLKEKTDVLIALDAGDPTLRQQALNQLAACVDKLEIIFPG